MWRYSSGNIVCGMLLAMIMPVKRVWVFLNCTNKQCVKYIYFLLSDSLGKLRIISYLIHV
ncbi:MAG: hypothetical protein JWQ66_4347 [Mucilaginibacter sp.]|nr:hypothetical protein [Mucilaginibacter sp.]